MVFEKNTFCRFEKLKSRKLITGLFSEGNSVVIYPYRLLWAKVGESSTYEVFKNTNAVINFKFPAQFAVAVPSKYGNAPARNGVKRQIREAYRLQKNDFYAILQIKNVQVILMVVFIASASKKITYLKIFEKMGQCLKQIQKQLIENQ